MFYFIMVTNQENSNDLPHVQFVGLLEDFVISLLCHCVAKHAYHYLSLDIS